MAKVEDLKPVYLIHGSQELRLTQALARLRASVAEVADLDFNLDSFDGETADVDAVIGACNTLPFASERRLVIVRDADRLPKSAQDQLAAYAENPAPTTVLVLAASKVAKNSRLYRAVSKLGGVAEYGAPKKRDYPAEVARMAADRGKQMSPRAAEQLVAAVGYDLRQLSVELDKAVAFVGDRAEIAESDVDEIASTSAPTSVFEFVEALALRDCARSLRLLGSLLDDGESVFGLHAMAVRRVRDLIAASSLETRGGGAAELAGMLGRPDWQVRDLPRQARSFGGGELVDLLRAAAQVEADMKTSRDARLAFERWIVRVCRV